MPTITLLNKKQFHADGGETLLEAASSSNLILEHSCRTGRCGVCRAKVVTGRTRAIRDEESLSKKDIDNGMILTCCRAAESDIELDIEDLGQLENIIVKTLPCRIDSLEYLTSNVLKVVLRLPPNSELYYLPGQYIDVIGKEGIRRSYSIANAPCTEGTLELHIRKVKLGVMSKYWFTEAKVNDLLRLEGPLGTFFLRENESRNIIFLATGTGIAPVKAMLEALTQQPESIARKNIHVYWGGRSRDDFYWKPELGDFEIFFHPVMSRPDNNWDGRYGYVQDVFLEDDIPLDDSVILACGSNEMIRAARELFISNGLSSKNFYSDAFVSSS